MLPVKKQDTEHGNTNPPAAFGFGKVLNSLQGLQKRLGDFSYGEVSIAEAKIKILVKQLSLLRDSLSRLVWLKLTVSDVNRRVSEMPVVNFDQVEMNGLEKHPQLHAILQASKLVRGQSMTHGNLIGSHVVSLDAAISDSTDHDSAAKQTGADTVNEVSRDIEEMAFTDAIESANESAGAARVSETKSFALHSVAPRATKAPLPFEELPSFTIPTETIAGSQDNPVGGRAKDWSFDRPEAALTSSGSFTESIDFEFPDETTHDPKPPRDKTTKTKSAQTGPSFTAPISQASPNTSKTTETNVAVTAQATPPKQAPEGAAVRLAESKALVPTKQDIDQRLLEAVIRNYGDFAGSPNLPAPRDTNTRIVPVPETPDNKPAAAFPEPTAAERKILNVQKSGDLDRQLKKIIKDYGEYDIYQRKTGIGFKTGGIIAFAVLGLVLAALYLFQAPAAVSIPQTGSTKQSHIPEAQNSAKTISSPAAVPRPMSPDAAAVSSGPLKDDQQ